MAKLKIAVIGAGFAGLRLVKKLANNDNFEIYLFDRQNYHQFQPLLYQVATAGLEPSSISFPLRMALRRSRNIIFRYCEVTGIIPESRELITSEGRYSFDRIIIATGTDTNFFNNDELKKNCLTMKSVPESLHLRNQLLSNFEKADITEDEELRDRYLDVVIVGGGATGVELAGALAEMRNTVLYKDYPHLDFKRMKIRLIEAGDRLLPGLSDASAERALGYLKKLGIEVMLNSPVKAYDGEVLQVGSGTIASKSVIWVAGVRGNIINGIGEDRLGKGGRIVTDPYSKVYEGIYALGDAAFTPEEKYPNGHPLVAPVAIQQADNLARNLILEQKGKPMAPFRYRNKGSMATVGRNLAVVELGRFRFGGFFAWLTWMFVHLMSILGIKNRLWIFFAWLWKYVTYDVSLRLILREKKEE